MTTSATEQLYEDCRSMSSLPIVNSSNVKSETFSSNEIIQSGSKTYQVLKLCGKGSFGEVFLSWCHTTNDYVAMKVLKYPDSVNVTEEAAREINFLKMLKKAGANRFNILQFRGAFICKNQYCLLTEALDISLRRFINERKQQPLELKEICMILRQIFIALNKLEELHIIHTDLKPENIMFVNTNNISAPLHVKIIDFGNAISLSDVHKYKTLQSLQYRSPEILLGVPYDQAIDVWSAGCIAAELYLGHILYQGFTTFDQICLICRTQGLPERKILKSAENTNKYFNKWGPSLWLLKDPEEYEQESGEKTFEMCKRKFCYLKELVCLAKPFATSHHWEFVDLLQRMLELSSNLRIKPKEALRHNFLTMSSPTDYRHDCI